MKILRLALLSLGMIITSMASAQNNTNINYNNNSNTIIFQGLPVIEKTVYVDRYRTRTIYVEKKRKARSLYRPICLQGFLWVYPEDLGMYDGVPESIITNINANAKYDRNDWRIPTPEELRLMENYGEECGLGDEIYLATDHRNGILRLVSTGKTVSEKMEEAEARRASYEAELAWESMKRKREEEARLKIQARDAALSEQRALINSLISSRALIDVNGVLWRTTNSGANSPSDFGVLKELKTIKCDAPWRIPTEDEFYYFYRNGYTSGGYLQMKNGVLLPLGPYAVVLKNGHVGFFDLRTGNIGGNENAKVFLREVSDKF